jgi:hypothetical protein
MPKHEAIWDEYIDERAPHAKKLYLLGYVKYRDEMKNLRRTFFCRRFDPKEGRFSEVLNPDYEYME